MKITKHIFIALIIGGLLGLFLPEYTIFLGEIGKIVIQLIKMAAVPLMFFVILNAVVKNSLTFKQGGWLLSITAVNTSLALGIGLWLSYFFQPGANFQMSAPESSDRSTAPLFNQKIDFIKTLQSYIPQSLVEPFASNAVIGVVIIALLLGVGLKTYLREQRETNDGNIHQENIYAVIHGGQRIFEIILSWCVKLVPLAVGAVVAKTIGQYGFSPFRSLIQYVGVCLLGFILHICLVYHAWLIFYVRMKLKIFWQAASLPMIYAFGINSSLATLPITLSSLKKLGASDSSSALGACIGTNLNNDGIILYEGVAVLFIAQLYGVDLSLSQQLLAIGACLVAAIGVAGVPEAGFISLSLVVATVGLPTEALPLLLTVDWLLARCRSGVNVLSDQIVSLILNRRELAAESNIITVSNFL